MKLFNKVPLFILVCALPIYSCTGGKSEKNLAIPSGKALVSMPSPVVGNETALLLKELKEGGDYVNTKQ